MHSIRRGEGRPLVLVHGLGGCWRSWSTILDALASEREVVAVDLPGHGDTPMPEGAVTLAGLADSLAECLAEEGLAEADLAGSSMGGRLVLELARRGMGGDVVALDPGGFWNDRERRFFKLTNGPSLRLVKLLQPAMPALTGNAVGRTVLFAQLSARPWALSGDTLLAEMRSYAAAPALIPAFRALVDSAPQERADSTPGRVTIGWGRQDLVTLPRQAPRALRAFPAAQLHWFEKCGHFPHWDRPQETAALILRST